MRVPGAPSLPATCFSDEVNGAGLKNATPNRIPKVGVFLQLMKSRMADRLRIGPVDQMV